MQRIALLFVIIGLAAATSPQRIRKELRALSPVERADLFEALWTMKLVNTTEGQRQFGPNFRNYDYFTVKHAVAVQDSRGDQGHFGPCFMTYHRIILLEFEAAMLSCLPASSPLQALPYWDAALDTEVGRYFEDPEHFAFSDAWFGSYTGNASAQYQVTDGAFAGWNIAKFDPKAYIPAAYRKSALAQYAGSPYGMIRGSHNIINTPSFARLPKRGGFPTLDGRAYPVFTHDDFNLCSNARWVHTWMDWQNCIEDARVHNRTDNTESFWNFASGLNWMHSQFHLKIGSWQGDLPSFPIPPGLNITMGDMMDVSTSPNDPLFAFHHTNLDRMNMHWQRAIDDVQPRSSEDDVLWNYPQSFEEWNNSVTSATKDYW
jgi:hypothetical protein